MRLFQEMERRGHSPHVMGSGVAEVKYWSTVCQWGALVATETNSGIGLASLQVFRHGWAWAGMLRPRSASMRSATLALGIGAAILLSAPYGLAVGMVISVIPEMIALVAIQATVRIPTNYPGDTVSSRLLAHVLDWDKPESDTCDGSCDDVRSAILAELWGSHVPPHSSLFTHDFRA